MPVSEFYARRRRFATSIAIGCSLLLLAQLHLGLQKEEYNRPRVAAAAGGVAVVHRTIVPSEDSGPGARLVILDPDLGVRGSISFGGDAAAILSEGDETTAFFGSHVSFLRGGDTVRGEDLGQPWDVRDAVVDPARGRMWIFGWNEGKILARHRTAAGWSAEIEVAESKRPVRPVASMDGTRGPLVAWRDAGSTRIRTALFDGATFVPRTTFEEASDYWDAVLVKDRILLVSYRRADRTFHAVTLRLQCCAECGQPPPPGQIKFLDPVLLFGRGVTGLAAASAADRLVVVLTRETMVLAGKAPAGSLLPESGARLLPVAVEPFWRRVAGAYAPILLFTCAVALIFLGISMFRERGRVMTPGARSAEGRPYADVLERSMAQVLDTLIVVPPALAVLSEFMSATAEASEPFDLGFWTVAAAAFAAKAAYHALMESTLGWTLGKKILGLKVLQADGSRATLVGALMRNLVRLPDADVGLPAILVMANTRHRQRLGDLLAGTIVVRERPTAEA
jgi:uncharacterized RDD family membrane protein YckC